MLYNIPSDGLEKQKEDFEYSLSLMAETINIMLRQFDEIRMLAGNHDIYFLKVMQGEIKLDRFWKMVGVENFNKKFFVSNYPFCALNDFWHITHPKTYSKIPMTVARALSTKYRKSVMSAHGHQWGLSTDISGRDICIDTGGLFDYKKMGYKWLTDNNFPQWVGGFWMIINNYAYGFSDLTTDWNFWLKKVRIK